MKTQLQFLFEFNCNLGKNEGSYPILLNTNKKCEWIWSIYKRYVFGGIVVNTISMSAVSALLCFIVNGHFKANGVYHPTRAM